MMGCFHWSCLWINSRQIHRLPQVIVPNSFPFSVGSLHKSWVTFNPSNMYNKNWGKIKEKAALPPLLRKLINLRGRESLRSSIHCVHSINTMHLQNASASAWWYRHNGEEKGLILPTWHSLLLTYSHIIFLPNMCELKSSAKNNHFTKQLST